MYLYEVGNLLKRMYCFFVIYFSQGTRSFVHELFEVISARF